MITKSESESKPTPEKSDDDSFVLKKEKKRQRKARAKAKKEAGACELQAEHVIQGDGWKRCTSCRDFVCQLSRASADVEEYEMVWITWIFIEKKKGREGKYKLEGVDGSAGEAQWVNVKDSIYTTASYHYLKAQR